MRQLALAALLAAGFSAAAAAPASAAPTSAARSAAAWDEVAGKPAPTRNGVRRQVRVDRFRSLTLDRSALAGVLAAAPRERTKAARSAPLTISLPAPDGSDRRFEIQKTSVMEAGLAAAHPEITTYAGVGVDDPRATVRLDLTSLGFHASVRSPAGSWYVDPYYRASQSVYASYRRSDLKDSHGPFTEADALLPRGSSDDRARPARRGGEQVQLRTYRLALASDPTYAAYVGPANVAAAKATLISRVNQVYEDDHAIRLLLVAGNDALSFETTAQMTAPGGPCGAVACYAADQLAACGEKTLVRTHVVIGQLIGPSNYDVGHVAIGVNGGGLAYLGVIGSGLKGRGCTALDTPVGDGFAVDYVAHELGHQFSANHTFNGTLGGCAGNIAGTAVEPGSGSTVMGDAALCGTDDLQPHTDPYFSQRSIDEVTARTSAAPVVIEEVQTVTLEEFDGTDSFKLTYDGSESAAIVRGTNYDAAGIKTAIEGIPGFPAGATVTVKDQAEDSSNPDDEGFSVTFGGTLAGGALPLTLTSPVGTAGVAAETTVAGPTRNGGTAVATANTAPVVSAPADFTIPLRTPFELTGSGSDAEGDALTYLWEQNDVGTGTQLVDNVKPDGPLFRVFGRAARVTASDTLLSPSPGQNAAGTSPTRTFPDLAQIAAGNTNAATGACPAAGPAPVAAPIVECFSEFLPTADYTGPLHFRLTARDGNPAGGGIGNDDTTLSLAPGAGPFRVTSQAEATTADAGAPLTVTWSVAGTSAAPIGAADVRIKLSTDGGQTFPEVLSASTPNDGTQEVALPPVTTTQGRIRVEAIGNVFFDVSRADLAIVPAAPKVTGDTPPGGATPPPAPPGVAPLVPDLGKVGRRLALSSTGRVSIPVGCRAAGAGAPPAICTGTLRLTARVRGRTRTVGKARFAVRPGTTKALRFRISAAARRGLPRSAPATVRLRVNNAGRVTRTFTKRVTLVRRG